MTNHRHYLHQIPPGITEADIYRLIDIIGITCPVAQHVFKKSAAAGQRGHKDLRKDWQDIMDSAKRKLEMLDEDDRSKSLLSAQKVEAPISDYTGYKDFILPILHGHEINTEFDSEERTKNIASSHGDGEHYDEVHPAPDPKVQGETWIINKGGKPDLPENTCIEVELRDETRSRHHSELSGWNWDLDGSVWNIIRYRIL